MEKMAPWPMKTVKMRLIPLAKPSKSKRYSWKISPYYIAKKISLWASFICPILYLLHFYSYWESHKSTVPFFLILYLCAKIHLSLFMAYSISSESMRTFWLYRVYFMMTIFATSYDYLTGIGYLSWYGLEFFFFDCSLVFAISCWRSELIHTWAEYSEERKEMDFKKEKKDITKANKKMTKENEVLQKEIREVKAQAEETKRMLEIEKRTLQKWEEDFVYMTHITDLNRVD
jgi:hypothetical protein